MLENSVARVVTDLRGGALGDFQFKDNPINPLHWATPRPGDTGIHGFGHFLCLDRWGPPSDAEGKNGMPYHGEAANVVWKIIREAAQDDGAVQAQLSAELPMAGLSVRRTLRLSTTQPVMSVTEEVRNENKLGRIYNMVQHPTVGPPFLDESTVVDCNGTRGFAQGRNLPTPEEPSFHWPQARHPDGTMVDLRHLTNDPVPNVVSYRVDAKYGWVTAASPKQRLLIGYVWSKDDYPWVSLWRDTHEGHPGARGLEFGTSGLHQPFPILTKKGQIWETPLFAYLDAGESAQRRYMTFLVHIPPDFAGVASIEVEPNQLVVRESSSQAPRTFTISTAGVFPW